MNVVMDSCLLGHGMRPKCQKKKYRSRDEAETDARRLLMNKSFIGKQARAYPCPECQCWHLSTKPRSGRTRWVMKNA